MIDVVGWRLDAVVELIRGPKDSTVRLSVSDADAENDESRIVTIVRNTIKLEEQAAQANVITIEEAEGERRIGVIDIQRSISTSKASKSVIRTFAAPPRMSRS